MKIELSYYKYSSPINKDPIEYGTDIFAYRGCWKEKPGLKPLLLTIPTAGESYTVSLIGPLEVELNENVWIFYDTPLAYYNSYEHISDLDGVRFCFGTITHLLELTEREATITFHLLETLSLKELLEQREVSIFLPKWEDFFESVDAYFWNGDGGFSAERIGDYLYVGCGVGQGAIEQNCLIMESNNKLYACMVSEWDSPRDFIYGGKFQISDKLTDLIFGEIDIVHKLFINKKIILKLKGSEYYKTPDLHQWCMQELNGIMESISPESALAIFSHNNRNFNIKSREEFLDWKTTQFDRVT